MLEGYERFPTGNVQQRTQVALKELIINAPDVRDASNPVNKDLYKTVKRVKYRIELEGDSWQLDEFAAFANTLDITLDKGETMQQPTQVEAFHTLTGDWEYKKFGQGAS